MLIKVNVPGSEHTVGDGIVEPISLGVGGVANEDASNRMWCKFVGSGVGSARIEGTRRYASHHRTEAYRREDAEVHSSTWTAGSKVKEK